MTTQIEIQKYDEVLNSSSTTLKLYAETVDTELGLKIQKLADKVSPFVKGIEAPQRVQIPMVSLRQNSSTSDKIPADTKPGQLYTSQSENLGDSLDFIPVFTYNIRKKWGDDDKIECQSIDGITGNKYGACKDCPYGRYDPNARPACSAGSSYYLVTDTLDSLYKIDFTKTSSKAGKNIRQSSLPPNLWSRTFTLSVEKVSANNRTYFVLKTTATNKRTPEDVSQLCDNLYDFFYSNYKKTLLMQAEYAKRDKAASETSPEGTSAPVDTDGEEMNFADSV